MDENGGDAASAQCRPAGTPIGTTQEFATFDTTSTAFERNMLHRLPAEWVINE